MANNDIYKQQDPKQIDYYLPNIIFTTQVFPLVHLTRERLVRELVV